MPLIFIEGVNACRWRVAQSYFVAQSYIFFKNRSELWNIWSLLQWSRTEIAVKSQGVYTGDFKSPSRQQDKSHLKSQQKLQQPPVVRLLENYCIPVSKLFSQSARHELLI
jgi:hypothetical protein